MTELVSCIIHVNSALLLLPHVSIWIQAHRQQCMHYWPSATCVLWFCTKQFSVWSLALFGIILSSVNCLRIDVRINSVELCEFICFFSDMGFDFKVMQKVLHQLHGDFCNTNAHCYDCWHSHWMCTVPHVRIQVKKSVGYQFDIQRIMHHDIFL
jgi:hypothetical protein